MPQRLKCDSTCYSVLVQLSTSSHSEFRAKSTYLMDVPVAALCGLMDSWGYIIYRYNCHIDMVYNISHLMVSDVIPTFILLPIVRF